MTSVRLCVKLSMPPQIAWATPLARCEINQERLQPCVERTSDLKRLTSRLAISVSRRDSHSSYSDNGDEFPAQRL